MEQQADLQSSQNIEDNSIILAPLRQSSPGDSGTVSVPTLRFPRPQGSQTLANWVSTSSPDIMASPPAPPSTYMSRDDDSSLSDSTFEIITRDSSENSENGSLDSHADSMYEALSSEDERYPHPDEVRAFGGLDDMSNSITSGATDSEAATDSDTDEEDEQEEDVTHTGHSVSQDGDSDAHDFLQGPLGESSVATIFAPTPTTNQPVNSIEFSEPHDTDVHIDKISVKHTIKEFSEGEAADLYDLTELGPAPERVSATIRQTMSQRCLSTHDAFRVLYVGNDKYKGEIILKLSRAITCSSSIDYNENKTLRRNTEGVYNIVSVPRGTVRDRDVELMEASGFQIKVDTCIGAEKKAIGSSQFRGDIIYSLTVDGGNGGKRFASVPAPGPDGARVLPAWRLPHVAVFCVSDDDEADDEMQDRQRNAWEFCERHAIPTLFISDHPVYAVSAVAARWLNHTNEDAVCLCLESRNETLEQRFPIDLDSFINIDNRQMNQNLAYLTGLQEPDPVADEKDVNSLDGSEQNLPSSMYKEWQLARLFPWFRMDPVSTFMYERLPPWMQNTHLRAPLWTGVIVLAVALLSLDSVPRTPGTGIQSGTLSENAHTVPTGRLAAPTSVETVTIKYTSTQTIMVPSAESASFGGLLSEFAHTVGADWPKSTACSAELYSDREVLIKVPAANQGAWRPARAMNVNVFRGKTRIPTSLSNNPQGIIVEIPVAEAYGVLNFTVISTPRPKIHETVAVDFGTPFLTEVLGYAHGALQGFAKTVGPMAGNLYEMVEKNYGNIVPPVEKVVQEKSQAWWDRILNAHEATRDYSSQMVDNVVHKVKDSIRVDDAATIVKNVHHNALQNVQKFTAEQQRNAETFRKNSDLAILKAQISSRLWWLKIQGKDKAYEEYERKARDFVSKKQAKPASDASTKNTGTGRWKV